MMLKRLPKLNLYNGSPAGVRFVQFVRSLWVRLASGTAAQTPHQTQDADVVTMGNIANTHVGAFTPQDPGGHPGMLLC